MKTVTLANKYFAIAVWNKLPANLQKQISLVWSKFYKLKLSTFLIRSFCDRYGINDQQLNLYQPASGKSDYTSFQDFFTRKLKFPMQVASEKWISPCQGFVCENGLVSEFSQVEVKGRKFSIQDIFDDVNNKISGSYSFMNIFLHNHNYHRFHSPVTGTVKQIKNISGQLNFLRPWFYEKKKVSSPSFVNERCIVEIQDDLKQSWFLSFVGGMGVGHIKLSDQLKLGALIQSGDELGYFLLGSTCCLATPVKTKKFTYLQKIEVGEFL